MNDELKKPPEVSEWDDINENEQEEELPVWGELELSKGMFAFITGTGRVPYDESIHGHPKRDPKRHKVIFVNVIPLAELQMPNNIEKNYVNWGPEWEEMIYPKLQKLISGLGYFDVKGNPDFAKIVKNHFVRIIRHFTGEKYALKDDDGNLTGKMGDSFIWMPEVIWATEEECRQDMYNMMDDHAQEVDVIPGLDPKFYQFKTGLVAAIRTITPPERTLLAVQELLNNDLYKELDFYLEQPDFIEQVITDLNALEDDVPF